MEDKDIGYHTSMDLYAREYLVAQGWLPQGPKEGQ